jgi:hypothetical protein
MPVVERDGVGWIVINPWPNDGIVTLLPFDRLLLVTQTNELISY